ncbi:hypothetical protein C8F04DRAFT_1387822 [Mycena alexandri]|uniref:Uncharacterized protein n=1 Tax=Mycena alexandri TaxID=1745969 RepID=A0AAD6TGN2_9AGAR|nr:hypothetical protein C8F04DRAFT_1387822 [Mycena alexandri]
MPFLATVPQDIHYKLLSSLHGFEDLSATVLSARALHSAFQSNRRRVLSAVGRNFIGSIFTDALLLARAQEKRDGLAALKVKGLSSSTVRLLVNNAETIGELQTIVFGLLKDQHAVDLRNRATMTQFAEAPPIVAASETESIRFKVAAYRFSVYCLIGSLEGRIAFLKRYPQLQILELSHFVNALWILASVIRGRPLETDRDWDLVSTLMSTGPHNILRLWTLKFTHPVEFKAALNEHKKCADNDEDEGGEVYFMAEWCDLMDAQGFPSDAGLRECAILDGEAGHERVVRALEAVAMNTGVAVAATSAGGRASLEMDSEEDAHPWTDEEEAAKRLTYGTTVTDVLEPTQDILLLLLLRADFAAFANRLVGHAQAAAGLNVASILTPAVESHEHLLDAKSGAEGIFLCRIGREIMWQQLDRRIDEVLEALYVFYRYSDRTMSDWQQTRLLTQLSKRAIRPAIEDEFDAFARWVGRRQIFSIDDMDAENSDEEHEEEMSEIM